MGKLEYGKLVKSHKTMKRPVQHIIETKSKKRFERLIPDEWVVRELSSDYGLDYFIEIFKNNTSTGQLFFVQLKGTNKEIINDEFLYQLSIDNVDYWNSITNPVLLVIYSTLSDKFWGLWTNNLKENFSRKRENQKKLSVTLTLKNLLSSNFFHKLEDSFENTLPAKINVSYKGNSIASNLLHQCLKKWLSYYYKDEIQFENHILPNSCIVEYNIENQNSIQIAIICKGKTHKLQPKIFLGNENFLFLPNIEIGKVPKPLSEILLLFALIQCEKNISTSIEIVLETISGYQGDYLPIESFLLLVANAIKYKRVSQMHELAKTLIDLMRIDEFQFLNGSILMLNAENSLQGLYQTNLVYAIDKITKPYLKGMFFYNLANSFRSTGDYYSASLNYQNARKYEPEYKNTYYWWYEYAGILFLSGHFKIAESFYFKSHKIEKKYNIPLVYGLIGDCKFFQGKFKESKKYFDRLNKQDVRYKFFVEEYILKSIIAENFVEMKLDSIRIDITGSDLLTQYGLDKNEKEFFLTAIQKNPLNGLAWFNYATILNMKGDSESALLAFITTACIQPKDIESWILGLMLAYNLKKFDLLTLIYTNANWHIGNEFLNHLSQTILELPYSSMDFKIELISMFSELSRTFDNEYVLNQK